jgi:MFS family permease
MPSPAVDRKAVALAVVVAALGYFVDIYDLILFGVVRKPSLAALGVAPADMQAVGERLLNYQMIGMLLGGVVWGVLGDKRGRLSVLFGSIITYSLANIANGFVGDVDTYAWLRLIAGVGLAGELGAGITLVSELVPARSRGWATTIVATVGIAGGVVATLVGDAVHWRTAYYIGGGLGLALLALRLGVRESAMFAAVRGATHVGRGRILALVRTPARLRRYLTVILIGVPIWYVVGILVFFSAEIGGALGVTPAPRPAEALRYCYAGLAVGDLASGALSQVWRSRRKAIAALPGADHARHARLLHRRRALGQRLPGVLRGERPGRRLLGGVRHQRRRAVRHQPARHGHHHRAQRGARRAGADDVRLRQGPRRVGHRARRDRGRRRGAGAGGRRAGAARRDPRPRPRFRRRRRLMA